MRLDGISIMLDLLLLVWLVSKIKEKRTYLYLNKRSCENNKKTQHKLQ